MLNIKSQVLFKKQSHSLPEYHSNDFLPQLQLKSLVYYEPYLPILHSLHYLLSSVKISVLQLECFIKLF